MAPRAKKKRLDETLRELMERADMETLEGETVREQMALAILRKAVGGDLKTVEFLLELLGETPQPKAKELAAQGVTIRLEPGVEELAR